jgi:predicted AlkP superfamily pyrophosphatase or phosphodiesterase
MKMLFFFVTLIFYHLTQYSTVNSHKHSTEPLLILVSFDGFRWDYLNTHNLTNFNTLKNDGVYTDYIYNAFATVTFPNHWTLVTGLYEETHGIIQNQMFDPVLNSKYDPSIVDSLSDFKWYAQNNITEPIWVTNQKANKNRLSAAEWIGSDVKIHDEAIITIPYNRTRPYKEIIDQFIQLFVKDEQPINFGAIYFDEPGNEI